MERRPAEKGVLLHADSATVSFNLWMTEEAARIRGGGLDIWQAMPNDTAAAHQCACAH